MCLQIQPSHTDTSHNANLSKYSGPTFIKTLS